MYKKIVHFSDSHFKKRTDHEHSKDVAGRFIEDLKLLSKTFSRDELIVYFSGDLVHERIAVSNELHSALNKFFKEILQYFDIRIIKGNHDVPQNHLSGHKDTIDTVLDLLKDDRIILMDEPKQYIDKNIGWCVYSMEGDVPKIENKDVFNVGCFHGIFLPEDHGLYKLTTNVLEPKDFRGCDVVLAGDIHQPLNHTIDTGEKKIEFIYANALRQERVNERLDDRGYVLYDIETQTFDRMVILSDYGIVDMEITEPDDIDKNKIRYTNCDENSIPKHANFRIGIRTTPIKFSVDNYEKEVKEKIKVKFDADGRKIKVYPIYANKTKLTLDGDLREQNLIENIADKEVFLNHVKRFCELNKDLTYNEDLIQKIHSEADITDKYDVNTRFTVFNIEEIWCENFLSYGKLNINFSDIKGLNSIVSYPMNEAGKSTLIKLITFILYQEVVGDNSATLDELLNQYVEDNYYLTGGRFNINGRRYVIERRVTVSKKGNASQKVVFAEIDDNNDKVVEFTKNEITAKVGTFKDFCLTHISTIGNLEELIHLKNAGKGDVLNRHIGLEFLSYKQEKAKLNRSEWHKKAKFKKYDIEQLIQDSKDKIKIKVNLDEKLETIIKNTYEVEEKQTKLTEEIIKIKTEIKPVKFIPQTKQELLSKLSEVAEHGKKLKLILENLNNIEHIDINILSERIQKGRDKITEIQNKINSFIGEDEIQKLNNVRKEYLDNKQILAEYKPLDIISIEKEIEELLSDISKYKSGVNNNDKEISKNQDRINKLKSGSYKCDDCGQEYTDTELINPLIDKIQNKINDLNSNVEIDNKQIKQLTTALELKKKEKQKYTSEEQRITKIKNKVDNINIQDLEKKIEDNQSININKLNQDKVKFEKLLTELEQDKTRAIENNQKLKDKITHEQSLTSSRDEYKNIKDLIDFYDKNEDIKNSNKLVEDEVKKLEDEVNSVKTRFMELNSERVGVETEKKILDGELKNITDILAEIEPEKELNEAYETYIAAVSRNGIPKMVMDDMLPVINSELNRLLSDNVDFRVELRLVDNKSYEFYYIMDGVERRLSACSGWQKLASCLAIKLVLGFVSALPRCNTICLDEILGAASEDNFHNIQNILSASKDFYDVILLISHNMDIQNFSDNQIYVRKGENNISEVILN